MRIFNGFTPWRLINLDFANFMQDVKVSERKLLPLIY